MAGIKLIIVASCLVIAARCDYNPGAGSGVSPTYGVPNNNFAGGGQRYDSESLHTGFSLGDEGIGYGRHAQGLGVPPEGVGLRHGGYEGTNVGGYGPGYGLRGHGGHAPSQPYQFGYAVKDYHTGNDFKQQEHSDGNTVKGQYRVLLPDGRTQIVTYTADWQTGFHADVKYEGEAVYPANNGGHGGPTYGVPGVGGGGYGGGSGGYGGSSYNNVGGGSGGHFGGPSSSYGPPGYKK